MCNYEVSFPGDADYGDEIELKFLYLGNTKAVVSLAKELKAGSKDQAVYGFDHQVNRKAGVLKFPFPLKAYVTLKQYRFLNYRPSYFKVAMQMAKAKGGQKGGAGSGKILKSLSTKELLATIKVENDE